MILAFDTHYIDNTAKTVGVLFENWTDAQPTSIRSERLTGIAEYQSGEFYKRELPCILSLLKHYDLADISHIVIDGYVLLSDDGKLGLGGYLYETLNQQMPIIGVAKSKFALNEHNALALLRGESKRPLYISAKGIELPQAFDHIQSMHGHYRMPTLLQILDTETKK